MAGMPSSVMPEASRTKTVIQLLLFQNTVLVLGDADGY